MQKNNSMLCVCFAILRKTRRCDGHHINGIKGVFKGGGGFKPPPPKFLDFFLKSEGKEIERKRKKKGCWGGGVHLNIFLGLIFFEWG